MNEKVLRCLRGLAVVLLVVSISSFFAEFAEASNINTQKVNIQIEMNESFSLNETISFRYSLLSDISQEMITILPYVKCPQAPMKLMQEKKVNLSLHKPY